eukprot:CAMPEP_0179017834 /NCGR_PEP_ID=MMETSP0796-20121207/4044_1 /TAXON_ID=73915 /ORGANISM="Pyrodinium bahamense, Strain pbaha01" /LENGTH=99 /DNA_ID=CAMNT_0020713577 /DNA_START=675 /DNA_END=974 /DNA_ORIENTATION=-
MPMSVLHPVIATLIAKSPLTSWHNQLEKQPPGQLVTTSNKTPGMNWIPSSHTLSAPQMGETTNWHTTPNNMGHLLVTRFPNSDVSMEAASDTLRMKRRT